jgi:signal peptidase II
MRRLVGSALFVVAADQLTKFIIRSVIAPDGYVPVVGQQVGLAHIVNSGSAFGLLNGQNLLLMLVAVVMAIALIAWRKQLAPWKGGNVLVGLILGGIAGNFIDRLWLGGVTDFLKLGPWPAFNVADSALTLGIIALVALNFIEEKKQKKKSRYI